jgi:hydroxyacylglutathione hydrolase
MKITQHVHAIKIPFQIPVAPGVLVPRYVYTYLIIDEQVTIIDSGVSGADETILSYLADLGLPPIAISTLILTHSHPDHIGAALPLQKASGCRILAHLAERDWIGDIDLQQKQRPVPGFSNLVIGSVKVDRLIEDGEGINCGKDLQCRVFHTPGHSNGSISLFLEAEGVLFSGDAIPQPGTMPIYVDVLDSARSIRKLMRISGVKILLSSWDEPRWNGDIHRSLQEGLDYLKSIHEVVLHSSASGEYSGNPMGLCQFVVTEIGLPMFAANNLVATSFNAHLQVVNQAELEEVFSE